MGVDILLTDLDGSKIAITKSEIETYRGTDLPKNGTVIYYKNGDSVRVQESFENVDKILDL